MNPTLHQIKIQAISFTILNIIIFAQFTEYHQIILTEIFEFLLYFRF
jgi:hypothetical protein